MGREAGGGKWVPCWVSSSGGGGGGDSSGGGDVATAAAAVETAFDIKMQV